MGETINGHRRTFGGDGNILYLDFIVLVACLYVFVKFNPSPLPTSSLEKSLSKPLKINDSLSLYNTAFKNLLGSLFLGLFTSEVKGFCLFSKTLFPATV